MLHWTRETRLLVVTVVLSVSVLLALARLRFPGREPGEPISLPARPLQQLAERASFDDLAATVSRVGDRIRPALLVVRLAEPQRRPRSLALADLLEGPDVSAGPPQVVAIHAGQGQYIAIAPDASREISGGLTVTARDVVRGLLIVARAGAVPVLSTSSPALPSFLVLAEATAGGVALRPVFGSAPDAVSDPRWPAPLVALGAGIAPPGGLLFSLEGAFVGAIVPGPQGPALVPAETLLTVATSAGEQRDHAPASLGVRLQRLDAPLRAAFGTDRGVVVTGVDPGGPSSGLLQPGDVIRSIANSSVQAPEGLLLRVASSPPGTSYDLEVLRRGATVRVQVISVARSEEAAAAAEAARRELGARFRPGPQGTIVVVSVQPDGVADRVGLRPGDDIWWVQGATSVTPRTLQDAWHELADDGRLAIGVNRSAPYFVTLGRP